jgi:hypothetical protein
VLRETLSKLGQRLWESSDDPGGARETPPPGLSPRTQGGMSVKGCRSSVVPAHLPACRPAGRLQAKDFPPRIPADHRRALEPRETTVPLGPTSEGRPAPAGPG